jgi:enoyl-CoA hydratase
MDLINKAVPFERLEDEVWDLAERLAGLPLPQLQAMKLIVNQAYENMGLHSTQLLGPILDGYMRNIKEGLDFVELAATRGVGAAVARRDAPFGDYSQAPRERQPEPRDPRRAPEIPARVTGSSLFVPGARSAPAPVRARR